MERILNERIHYISPFYQKGIGDSTKVKIDDELIILNQGIWSVLKALTRYYMVNMDEVKKEFRPLVNIVDLMPIPIDEENIFIPYKARQPKYKGDRAFGYINLDFIDKLAKDEKDIFILMKDGDKLKVLAKEATIMSHIRNGNIMKKFYRRRDMKGKYFVKDKSDIEKIYKKLEEINEKLEEKTHK